MVMKGLLLLCLLLGLLLLLLLLLSTLCELFRGRILKEVSYVHSGRREK